MDRNPFADPSWCLLATVRNSPVYQYAPDIYGIDSRGFASPTFIRSFERVIQNAPSFTPRFGRIVYIGEAFQGHDLDVKHGRASGLPCDVLAIVTERPMFRGIFKAMKRDAPTPGWRKLDVFRNVEQAVAFVKRCLAEPLS